MCLNDRSSSRINIRSGTESAVDFTLVSDWLAGFCSWKVVIGTTVGGDCYPILNKVGLRLEEYDDRRTTEMGFQ